VKPHILQSDVGVGGEAKLDAPRLLEFSGFVLFEPVWVVTILATICLLRMPSTNVVALLLNLTTYPGANWMVPE
jgi:hypothetical protein